MMLIIISIIKADSINTFGKHDLYCAGVATSDPGEAPPLAGLNMKSQVAYDHNTPYLHDGDIQFMELAVDHP